jgi:DNA-binding transcriptional LysR family regulator
VAVKNLEESLKTTLFHRSREGVKLTRTGQELLEHAVQVFALLDLAEERIVGLESDEIGRFVIGCHESLGAYFLPAFMRSFLGTAPGIEVSLWNGTSAAVTDAVLARDVDYGIVVNPRPHPDLVLVELFHDAMDVLVAVSTLPGGRSLERDAAHARLREGPLIFAGRVGQATELVDRLAAESLLPTRRLSCGDLELVKSLALEGVGVALLPRRVASYGQVGKLTRLHPGLPFIPDIISLVYRGDMHRTRASIRLKDALVTHGRAMEAPDSMRGTGLATTSEPIDG